MRPGVTRTICVALVAFWSASLPNAPVAHAGIEAEFHGARSTAMGEAHRGVGTSNDTLYVNPAGMAIIRRYGLDVQYGYDARLGLSHVNISAVDSKSGPVAGAAAFTNDRGGGPALDANLNRFYGGIAYALTEVLAFGVTGRHLRGDFKDEAGNRQNVSLYTGDVGLSLRLGDSLGLGVSYQNAVRTNHPELTPHAVGAGVAFATPQLIVAFDSVYLLDERNNQRFSHHAGGEYFVQGGIPVRIGWRRTGYADREGTARLEDIVSAGIGWVNPGGAIDVAYTQSLARPRERSIIVGLHMFL